MENKNVWVNMCVQYLKVFANSGLHPYKSKVDIRIEEGWIAIIQRYHPGHYYYCVVKSANDNHPVWAGIIGLPELPILN